MNQVNPFYIIGLSIVLIIFLFYKNINLQHNLEDSKNSFKETKKVALELKQYKDSFSKTKNSFKREIASKDWIKENDIKLSYRSDGVDISANKLKLDILNRLTSRIFNGIYKISSFNIETKDNKTASLEMSIKW